MAFKAQALTITDDRGKTITLTKPASRIVSLYGGITDILLSLNLENKLIAWTKQDQALHPKLTFTQVGTHLRPSLETILSLKPDLILQMGKRPHSLLIAQKLEHFGLTVAIFDPQNFTELFQCIHKIGILTHTEPKAKKLIQKLKAQLENLQPVPSQKRPTVFFEVRYPNLLGAGKKSFVSEIIFMAGGQNVLNHPKKLVHLNPEVLLKLNPDVYIVQVGPMNPVYHPLANRTFYQDLKAVKKKNIFLVKEEEFSRPGPNTIQAAIKLHNFLKEKRLIPQN